ncbi:hypothetical protein GCM10027169_29990 [Gordonia jinhuaensis]|uniref:DUF2993 domain-containing protein n=1 Tax=Gordonia jinhuaensis TaxID=1517702 RepID=A0A916T758_9ACTN|nr:DUF2993 domain-containing protein [Gordonia jinhuaensis]GGB32515.1 hypothetical protein GCM10011489_20870 [Gordonia jinhuaensis]
MSSAVRKTIIGVVVVAVVVIAALFAVDTGLAISAENRLSTSLRSGSGLDYDPEVTIGGFPFASSMRHHEYPRVGITARGVDLGDGRHGDLRSTLHEVSLPGNRWSVGPHDVLTVSDANGSLRLDSVNFGRFLGITDLTVTTPAPRDKAGGGGPGDGLLSASTGILTTGTVTVAPGLRRTVSVTVDLHVVDGALRVVATGFYSGPAEHASPDLDAAQRQAALAAFTRTLPVLPLPWGMVAVKAHTEGSDVILGGEFADAGSADGSAREQTPRRLRAVEFFPRSARPTTSDL